MELDSGLYWIGRGDVAERAVRGQSHPFYDPSHPTVIYVHGWQPGAVKEGLRETFNYARKDPRYGVDIDIADFWIDGGWNVGLFYWDQLADEADVGDAEAKIWAADGPRGMRWIRGDETYATEDVPTKSAAELFVDALVDAMAAQTNDAIRFTGHSLGSQMVVLGAKLLADRIDAGAAPRALLPKRIALLDPFWSNGSKDYLDGRWTGEVSRDHIADLVERGIAFERYKTSNITDLFVGDANAPLTALIGQTELVPGYISSVDLGARHVAAPFLYFHSFAAAPPPACDGDGSTRSCAGAAASASASDETILSLMSAPFTWIQTEGTLTEAPEDNAFDRRPR